MALINLKFICPYCGTKKYSQLQKSPILEGKDNLTSFFIDKGLVCDHQFQALINKEFIIQRYLKINQNYID